MRTGTSRPRPASRATRRAPRRRRLLAVVAALALGLAGAGMPAQADERQDAVDQQEEAERKQAEVTASLEGVSASLGQAYLDLQAAETALGTAQTELDAAEADLAAKEREQQLAADRLAVAEADLAAIEEEAQASQTNAEENSASVADLVVSTYQGDSAVTSWTYVLASESVDDLTQRASTMEIATGVQESVLSQAEAERAQDANRRARQDATTTRVATLKDEADAAEAAAQTARDDAQTRRDEVAALTAERQTAAAQFETEKAGLEAQQAQAAADAAAAAETIARIDAANQASAGYTGASSGEVAASSLGGGDIGHPITGSLVVASPFGYRIHPITGQSRLHAGVDLVAGQGVPQYAAVSGTVTHNINSSCGNGIFINGGVINGQSVVVAYCHLSQISVSNGAYVSKGQQIGLTGATGGATGPHVHFEVILNGTEVDPMTLPGF
ncbi:M23 family metallopeptidase [Actinomyces howellii]|uniref:Glycyl-glycine endopeptidase ALE-1 n=1 Tax=Actinomyces howellii TaxID=52771 RepID=A0A3S4R2T1_9ACTO|nr:M23 family metallopeptidase [Actinomyces howellii]VEG30154.1 Glycyl-glycine endopeptidase ALE-1 precursor [Actinomyces howellii]